MKCFRTSSLPKKICKKKVYLRVFSLTTKSSTSNSLQSQSIKETASRRARRASLKQATPDIPSAFNGIEQISATSFFPSRLRLNSTSVRVNKDLPSKNSECRLLILGQEHYRYTVCFKIGNVNNCIRRRIVWEKS
jgi:hypothetical protein